MSSLDALQVRDLIVAAVTGDNRTTIESSPAMSWLLPELDERVASLDTLLGGRALAVELEVTRTDAKSADRAHDEPRRFLFKLLDAASDYGPAGSRAAIARALSVLFPDGLKGLVASYRVQVANAPDFAQRLERPEVVAGLEALGAYVKGVKALVRECVVSGERLAEVVHALDQAEVDAGPDGSTRAVFDARNAALKSWSTFVTVAEHALADDGKRLEKLLHRWRAFQQEARRSAQGGVPAPSDTPSDTAPGSTHDGEDPV